MATTKKARTQKIGYRGNINLKPLGYVHQLTAFEASEYAKCASDPIYFIETYVKITTLDHGIQPFTLYPYQKKLILAIHNSRKVIAKVGRQLGKTQVSAAYILWYTLFQSVMTVSILANKLSAAREILRRYQDMFQSIPLWMQQGIVDWNKGNITLENGSMIFTSATSRDGTRGRSVNLIYVDEVAIIPNLVAEEFFTAIYPTISSGTSTKLLLTSTPLGYNSFWKHWDEAVKSINGFLPIEVHYSEIPGRDAAWAAQQLQLLGELKFTQEVLCEFLGSSLTLVRGDVISKMIRHAFEYSKDNLDIGVPPIKNHSYVIVADTSRGVGGDYSAFTVMDVTEIPYKMVAKYKNNKISPLLYPSVIHRVAKDYNDALILVEINDIGGQVADVLYQDYEYENIVFVTKEKGGQKISAGFTGNSQAGVRTDKLVKRVGCSTLKTLIEENKLLVHDSDIISEFATFTETKTGFFAADGGYHDDLVMTLVLFSWMTTQAYFKDLTNNDLRKSLFESQINNIEQELTPFGIVENGIAPEKTYEVIQGEMWEVADAPPKFEDFGRIIQKERENAKDWNW
jgi:hypothetical protein